MFQKCTIENSSFFRQRAKSGFSMIELLVVVAIMVIMTAVLFAKRDNNGASTDVEAAARQIAAELRGLQNGALSGKMIGTTAVCNFVINTQKDTINYTIHYDGDCSTPTNVLSTQDLSIKNVAFANNDTVTYKAPRGTTAAGAIGLYSKKDATKTMYVCVYSSGNVVESKTSTCP